MSDYTTTQLHDYNRPVHAMIHSTPTLPTALYWLITTQQITSQHCPVLKQHYQHNLSTTRHKSEHSQHNQHNQHSQNNLAQNQAQPAQPAQNQAA